MLSLIRFYDRHKKLLYLVFLVFILMCALMAAHVHVNYDMTEYLPEDSITKRSISLLESEFTYPGTARVMISDVTMLEAAEIKNKIAQIDGISTVLWLDDYADITKPEAFINQKYLNDFYLEEKALFTIEFSEGNYSTVTDDAIQSIYQLTDGKAVISGAAEDSRYMREVVNKEMTKIILIIVPICLLILMLAGKTWIEPLLYITSIGVAVVFNMGTNLIFPNISFITQSMSAVLQLAISMDYSLFLFHRYLEERDLGNDVHQALSNAVKTSFSSISSSALTTVAGFLALIFMSYSIGTDLGLVLAKGIAFSFLCTVTFLPLLILSFHRVIDRTRHSNFMPKFQNKRFIQGKIAVIILAIVIAIPCFLAQQNNTFLYGDTSGSAASNDSTSKKEQITSLFGESDPVMVLVPNNNIGAENALCKDLEQLNYVRNVQSISTLADPTIPRDILPESLTKQFLSEKYSRIVVFLRLGGENEMTYQSTKDLEEIAERHFPGQWYMAGTGTATTDIKNTIETDTIVITLFSLIAVGSIVLLTFRSISIPILLLLVIELSIWINMSVPYFQGTKLVFIGYLVINSIQLGATIDYAILMTSRYLEHRTRMHPEAAALGALQTAGSSVITSALILTAAGTAEGILSSIGSVSQIGYLLGRGALLSGLIVLTVLPRLLVLCDKLIMKTTLQKNHPLKRSMEVSE
ncbi:MAG: MMPL family transporter [Bacillota bacterium]|nr:MMPL family transporter [Bacillota bacterium]